MTAVDFYNEIDPFAAGWLRNLIAAGELPPGVVDTRDVRDLDPDELQRYRRCHFFAGIGGWALALELCRWPADMAVWTGSCPCQPFSAAGRSAGFADERHLWPSWFHLIDQCRPPVVLGEQVAAAVRHGWLDLVHADLEGIGYACGDADLPAAGIGAPHIRQRLFFVANCPGRRLAWLDALGIRASQPGRRGSAGTLADCCCSGLEGCDERALGQQRAAAQRGGGTGADDDDAGCGQQWRGGLLNGQRQALGDDAYRCGEDGFWDDCEWIPCRDGRARPVEPGSCALAHGVSNRVGLLRGYGNAIVPEVGAAFAGAFLDVMNLR